MSDASDALKEEYISLFIASLVPLRTVLPALTWILHDYFVTLEDEIRYIWSQQRCFSKFMYLWIRYYSIVLLIFDATQIHLFSRPGITGPTVCVAMDSIIRIVGAISLWSVEIIMQLRVYAIYKCSKRIVVFNFVLFLGSVAGFMYVLVYNAERRRAVIAQAVTLPLPGCPSIHSGIEWAQWVPATAYEGVLFSFALWKTVKSTAGRVRNKARVSIYELLLRDNLFYFFAIAAILVFNNLMVVGLTHIPWFSYGPFHAAVEILTCRMLVNLRRASMIHPFDEDTELTAISGTSSSSDDHHRPKRHGRGLRTDESWRVAPGLVSSSLGTTTGTGTMLETLESIVPVRADVEAQVAGPSGWEKQGVPVKVKIRGSDPIVEDELVSPVEVEVRVKKKLEMDDGLLLR
ncbi:uncharacterized protein STEHIDRAFT_171293 [Stereum hirsutum FP-91666 SS1]|uniref:uncharacterized protein n=1 Tax=Stereum hirsutum (strain FP-91666) TaxID=721885 RepID=UPI000444A04E|nr:uncharacterized protein STEHIDRAFT_171293 [Stereum hirsutum FP-91666 SS1]EIM82344.1 hypothetical protein STEHIDRAFT_171293 [Stereum hirsutum FP-91666 SS1]